MNPEGTNPQGSTQNPQGGANPQDVNAGGAPAGDQALSLTDIEKMTGRKFESRADFEKHYTNLQKNYGDVGNAIGAYKNKLKAAGVDITSVEQEGNATFMVGEENSGLVDRVSSLERTLQRNDFLRDYPNASNVLDAVEAIAESKKISYKEAFLNSSLSKLAPTGQPNATIAPTKQVGAESSKLPDLVNTLKEHEKKNRTSREDLRQDIVREAAKERGWPTYQN